MAPIVIIIISLLGLAMEKEEVSSKIYQEVSGLVGQQGMTYLRSVVENYSSGDKGVWGTFIGILVFLITSTTFFSVLQNSINYIWKIKAKPKRGLVKLLKDRLLSFGLILSMGFIMLISLMVEAALSYLRGSISNFIPGVEMVFLYITNIVLTLGILTVIFAMIFRFLPDAKIKWRVTWIGAFITAILFELGRLLIGLFMGNTNLGVLYGAAGSLVIILLWVFYSSIIFFFGAEITQQYALITDHRIIPKDHAVKIEINEVTEKS